MHLKKIFTSNRERRRKYRTVVKVIVAATLTNSASVNAAQVQQELTLTLQEESISTEPEMFNLEQLMETEAPEVDLYEMIQEKKRKREEAREKKFQEEMERLENFVERKKEEEAEFEAEIKDLLEARAEEQKEVRAEVQERARKEEQRQIFAHVADEEFLLAQMLQHECGDNREDQICAGSVILNRVRTNYRDFRNVNTIAEVLYQPGQYYSGTKDYIEPGENAKEVAHGLLTGEIPCYEEKTLFQTTTWESWMNGVLGDSNLPGANQCYAYPLDFEEGCR